ncbi:DEAD/DEAH box helicase [Bifidobacterium choloepi]|uniref:DNA2/NAM7 helicase-like C-terminal domain-containing protein n=1 Tax=Bifidobacterium choloepi TaxID=2614131 RepID=A0A6I5NFW9_9BIFI|nr:DEAD/DEAH box helicase [Bifidobacterium choloepi]NEG69253.1 hypothetical protein [Bifidobacterium choloepi]
MGWSVDSRTIFRYCSDSIDNDLLVSQTFRENDSFITVPKNAVWGGAIDPAQARRLFTRNDSAEGIDVVLAWIVLTYPDDRLDPEALMLVPARLNRRGQLSIDTRSDGPWIPRKYLADLHGRQVTRPYCVGTFSSFRQHRHPYRPNRNRTKDEQWRDYLNSANRLYGNVANDYANVPANGMSATQPVRFKNTWEPCFIARNPVIKSYGQMKNIYDECEHVGNLPLLKTMVEDNRRIMSQVPAEDFNQQPFDHAIVDRMRACRGCAASRYAPSLSQRVAIHHYTELRTGDVLAVSGPPGTGKTASIQNMIAHEIVTAALGGADHAPVIVGTSTNNQAVTNLIDAFATIAKDNTGLLDHRWIPQATANGMGEGVLSGIGVYLPANGKWSQSVSKELPCERRQGEGLYLQYSNKNYVDSALPLFLEKAEQLLTLSGQVFLFPEDKDEGARQLRLQLTDLLRRLDSQRMALIDAVERESTPFPSSFIGRCIRWWRQRKASCETVIRNIRELGILDAEQLDVLEHWEDSKSKDGWQHEDSPLPIGERMRRLDEALDTTVRFCEFWLAVHIFEARWFEDCKADAILGTVDHDKNLPTVNDRYWGQLANLTPVMVMTTAKLADNFTASSETSGGRRQNVHPDFQRIDMLVVDEAGQVDTTKALGAFALAKKAVVAGDVKQLDPVWSCEPDLDNEYSSSSGVDETLWQHMEDIGLTASRPSSILRLAGSRTRWKTMTDVKNSEGDTAPGLFLAEHYRCMPEIIEYCNELSYDSNLVSCRKTDKEQDSNGVPVAKPLSYVLVPGSRSERVGTSRKNKAEAEAIVDWINAHGEDILRRYESDDVKALADCLAIVTPFEAQERMLLDTVRQRCFLRRGQLGNLRIGTAHKMQGAECPIVLYSSVYGQESDQAWFVEQHPNLMNVAVSRAKDAFVMFCAPRRLQDTRRVMSMFFRHAKEQTNVDERECVKEISIDGPLVVSRNGAQRTVFGIPVLSWKESLESGGCSLSARLKELARDSDFPPFLDAEAANKILEDNGYIRKAYRDGVKHWLCTPLGYRNGILQTIYDGNKLRCAYLEEAKAMLGPVLARGKRLSSFRVSPVDDAVGMPPTRPGSETDSQFFL